MDSPCFLLSTAVVRDVMRLISYGWQNDLIVGIIRRRYQTRITSRCIDAIRTDSPCPPKCRANCWLRLDT